MNERGRFRIEAVQTVGLFIDKGVVLGDELPSDLGRNDVLVYGRGGRRGGCRCAHYKKSKNAEYDLCGYDEMTRLAESADCRLTFEDERRCMCDGCLLDAGCSVAATRLATTTSGSAGRRGKDLVLWTQSCKLENQVWRRSRSHFALRSSYSHTSLLSKTVHKTQKRAENISKIRSGQPVILSCSIISLYTRSILRSSGRSAAHPTPSHPAQQCERGPA